MTQEDKELLLRDLSARLPYGVIIEIDKSFITKKGTFRLSYEHLDINNMLFIKPYLRPMSSMTEEETEIFNSDFGGIEDGYNSIEVKRIDWLNKKIFDYRGLIEKGLALEAPKDMYKNY